MPSLKQLQTFLAVYRGGSITAAAAHLNLSQPAVSAQLRALETELDRPLFVRLARGVSPTAQAHALVRQVAPHLDALEGVQAGLHDPRMHALVHLGGPADMLAAAALPVLASLVGPGLRLRVRTGIAEDLLEALLADELDLVVATRRNAIRGLHFEPLFDESFVLVAGRRWSRQLDPASIAQDQEAALADVPLVAFDEELPILRKYWRECFGLALERPAGLVVPDLRAVCRAVAAGAGVSVVPRYLAADQLASGDLVQLHRPERPPTNPISLAYRSAGLRRPGVQDVRERLVHTAHAWERGDDGW